MTAEWTVTQNLLALLKELFAEPRTMELAEQMSAFYPTIMWSLGGTLQKRGEPPQSLPPRYDVGLAESSSVGNLIRIPDEAFGTILFQPSKDDAASSRRTIDFDGTNIVVR